MALLSGIVGLLLAPTLILGSGNADAVVAAPPLDASYKLHAAIEACDRNDLKNAKDDIEAVVDDPAFGALDDSTRHFAFELAVHIFRNLNEPVKAQRFAVLATEGPEQNLDDWKSRLSIDLQLKLVRDEAECVTTLERRWGGMAGIIADDTIFRVFAETAHTDLEDVRLPLLEALYERRWHPTDGTTASALWRELTRLLLESHESGRAQEVAILVDEPDDIIGMRADRRFDPIMHSDFVRSSPERAAQDRLKTLQAQAQRTPRSLAPLERLLNIMVTDRMDDEVVKRTDELERRVQKAGVGTAVFDDFNKNYEWILRARSNALRHLGRFDEALVSLHRAAALPAAADMVSQPINLGYLLITLGRPGEVLALLPDSNRLSPYGTMAATWLRLAVATAEHRDGDAAIALSYLREHRADAPAIFQSGLLVAGQFDDAERWLIERLNDPNLRRAALLEVQHYAMPKLTPWELQHRQLLDSLHQRAEVQAAIEKVGYIGSYHWRYED
jgi:hypothetical protein